jgi:hypothetical protein
VPAAERTSAAAPRFDTFCDALAGQWIPIHGDADDRSVEVEEVMRSCGGAVQGIKDRGVYHNRATEGFTYFQCGSYSAGTCAGEATDGATAAASLSFSSGVRQLVEIRGAIGIPSTDDLVALQLRSARSAKPEASAPGTELRLVLGREVGCGMPSGGAWNNARVQWKAHDVPGSSLAQM